MLWSWEHDEVFWAYTVSNGPCQPVKLQNLIHLPNTSVWSTLSKAGQQWSWLLCRACADLGLCFQHMPQNTPFPMVWLIYFCWVETIENQVSSNHMTVMRCTGDQVQQHLPSFFNPLTSLTVLYWFLCNFCIF